MEDLLWWQNGDVEEHLHGWGHYHETYEKIGGRWLIASRQLTRLKVESTPDFNPITIDRTAMTESGTPPRQTPSSPR